jgi:hypothetical protein
MATDKFSANCKISGPIVLPEEQSVKFNGFAWSNARGIVIEYDTTITSNTNQDWQEWLGTQQ